MEAVRNSLDLWLDDDVDRVNIDWAPSIAHERFPVFCSQQLNASFQEAIS